MVSYSCWRRTLPLRKTALHVLACCLALPRPGPLAHFKPIHTSYIFLLLSEKFRQRTKRDGKCKLVKLSETVNIWDDSTCKAPKIMSCQTILTLKKTSILGKKKKEEGVGGIEVYHWGKTVAFFFKINKNDQIQIKVFCRKCFMSSEWQVRYLLWKRTAWDRVNVTK